MKYGQLFLIFAVSVFLLSSCWWGHLATEPRDIIFAVQNETPYSIVLSLYINRSTPIDLITDEQIRYAEINMDNVFGRVNWGIDSVMVFNLSDTTSIFWNAVTPPNSSASESYFCTLFGGRLPQWITAPADVLKWEVSRKSWSIIGSVDEWNEKRLLTVTPALLEIMEKDYSMLERFPEFYE